MNLHEMIKEVQKIGYSFEDAGAKVCQDIVLKGISDSDLSRNVTIKGGVVMRSISGNVRRVTQDIDIATQVTVETAIARGYSKCGKCWN